VEKKLFLVETVSVFRHRYVVEAEHESHACDEVVMNVGNAYKDEFQEFSQHHVDEMISSSREISMDEYLKLFDKDNDYLKNWPVEQKTRFINVIDYGENDGNEEKDNID
jgi:hypothetical protein